MSAVEGGRDVLCYAIPGFREKNPAAAMAPIGHLRWRRIG
jgi:hypothetical protein